MPQPQGHQPVLQREVLALLAPVTNGRYLDATFGGGGHTRAILEAAPDTLVFAFDRDPAAAARAEKLARDFPGRLHFANENFDTLAEQSEQKSTDFPARDSDTGRTARAPLLKIENLQAALFDLGLSSFQLDETARGFSFRADAPADMRMDPRAGAPASAWLETAPEADIARALRDYGEEKNWRRLTRAILDARGAGALARTATLAALISDAIPARERRASKIHPATRAFQGIRIALNDELASLSRALPAAFARLASGGVLCVISFHSLEDRIVKQYFRRLCGQPADSADSTPQQFRPKHAEPLTRKPITPTDAELAANPRSRSAKLRAIKKL